VVVATRLIKLILNPYDVTFSAGGSEDAEAAAV